MLRTRTPRSLLISVTDPLTPFPFLHGSKDNVSGRVGAACYSPDLNTFSLLGLHSYFSIFSAECIAIKNAIKMALESSHDNVFIYSDSLSALQALIKSSVTINTVGISAESPILGIADEIPIYRNFIK